MSAASRYRGPPRPSRRVSPLCSAGDVACCLFFSHCARVQQRRSPLVPRSVTGYHTYQPFLGFGRAVKNPSLFLSKPFRLRMDRAERATSETLPATSPAPRLDFLCHEASYLVVNRAAYDQVFAIGADRIPCRRPTLTFNRNSGSRTTPITRASSWARACGGCLDTPTTSERWGCGGLYSGSLFLRSGVCARAILPSCPRLFVVSCPPPLLSPSSSNSGF